MHLRPAGAEPTALCHTGTSAPGLLSTAASVWRLGPALARLGTGPARLGAMYFRSDGLATATKDGSASVLAFALRLCRRTGGGWGTLSTQVGFHRRQAVSADGRWVYIADASIVAGACQVLARSTSDLPVVCRSVGRCAIRTGHSTVR